MIMKLIKIYNRPVNSLTMNSFTNEIGSVVVNYLTN